MVLDLKTSAGIPLRHINRWCSSQWCWCLAGTIGVLQGSLCCISGPDKAFDKALPIWLLEKLSELQNQTTCLKDLSLLWWLMSYGFPELCPICVKDQSRAGSVVIFCIYWCLSTIMGRSFCRWHSHVQYILKLAVWVILILSREISMQCDLFLQQINELQCFQIQVHGDVSSAKQILSWCWAGAEWHGPWES